MCHDLSKGPPVKWRPFISAGFESGAGMVAFLRRRMLRIFEYLDYSWEERYSSIPLAPARPASIARITVAAPVTASPPA
jgi:hypothetical protein